MIQQQQICSRQERWKDDEEEEQEEQEEGEEEERRHEKREPELRSGKSPMRNETSRSAIPNAPTLLALVCALFLNIDIYSLYMYIS